MKLMKQVLCLLLIMVTTSCSVVEVDGMDSEGNTISFEDNFPASAIDVNTYLVGGATRTWVTVAFTIDGVNGFQNCRLDDQIRLNDDLTYSYDGGTTLCGAEDNQKLKSGNWEVNASNRTLTFDKGTDREAVFYIESLDEEEIVVSSHYYSWKVMGKFTHE